MIRVTDVYEGFYMSIGNDLPLLIHVIADSHGTPFKQQPRIEDKLSKIACSYLKFILPQDMNKWSYVKTLFSNDINDTDNGGFYYFKGRTFIKKIPLISDPRTQLEVLVPFLNQDEDNNNDKAALLQSQHQVPGFRTVTPRSSRNYCRLKIKALSSNKTFIHKFDPLDTTLSQVREWMETLLHKDLPLNQYKFIQRYPYRIFNQIDELKTLASLNFLPSIALSLVEVNLPICHFKFLHKYKSILTNNRHRHHYHCHNIIIRNLIFTLKIVWDYFKFLDREKIDYIFVDDKNNSISNIHSDNNIPIRQPQRQQPRHNFTSGMHNLNEYFS